MSFRKLCYEIHLYLGVISGIIVFIVCMTGAIWAFKINGWVGNEVKDNTPQCGVGEQFLKPSELLKMCPDSIRTFPQRIVYTKERAATVYVGEHIFWVNPYSGNFLGEKVIVPEPESYTDFWRFIGRGHRSLWIPGKWGTWIVNYGTLLFIVVLISGLVIWAPRKLKSLKNRLCFHWKSSTRFTKYMWDLHSIGGFYSAFFLIVIACTGLVWGLDWWSDASYRLLSMGQSIPERVLPVSDINKMSSHVEDCNDIIDDLFMDIIKQYPNMGSLSITYPKKTDSAIYITINKDIDRYYNSDRLYFDRYSGMDITPNNQGLYMGRYSETTLAEKIRRMNYDIHIGAVWGTPGRILVFFIALFGASLPITGCYIFIKKNKTNRNRKTV